MKKTIGTKLIVLLLIATLFVAAACSTPSVPGDTTPGPEASPAQSPDLPTQSPGVVPSLLDLAGRSITIHQTPERVVSLTPSNTEILFALGVGDQLVGIDAYSNYPEAATNIATMGDYAGPNIEAIVNSEADVVFTSTKLQQSSIDALVDLGITVVCSEATNYADIYTSIALIAQVMGVDASSLITNMQSKEQEVLSQSQTLTKQTVYYVMGFGEGGNYTSGPDTFINTLIQMGGGIPVTNDAPVPWPNYSLEQVIDLNPDVLLVSSYLDVEALKQADGYRDLAAVKEGRVYPIQSDLFERPGPRIVDALQELYDTLVQALVS